eukprot:14376623-Heterocapsa_arctica.AAC.1
MGASASVTWGGQIALPSANWLLGQYYGVCCPSAPKKCACFLSSICSSRRLPGSFGLLMSRTWASLCSWSAGIPPASFPSSPHRH